MVYLTEQSSKSNLYIYLVLFCARSASWRSFIYTNKIFYVYSGTFNATDVIYSKVLTVFNEWYKRSFEFID